MEHNVDKWGRTDDWHNVRPHWIIRIVNVMTDHESQPCSYQTSNPIKSKKTTGMIYDMEISSPLYLHDLCQLFFIRVISTG